VYHRGLRVWAERKRPILRVLNLQTIQKKVHGRNAMQAFCVWRLSNLPLYRQQLFHRAKLRILWELINGI